MKTCKSIPGRFGVEDDQDLNSDEDLFRRIIRCNKCPSEMFETRRELDRHRRRKHLKIRVRKRVKLARWMLHMDDGREEDGDDSVMSSRDSIVSSVAPSKINDDDDGVVREEKREKLQWKSPRWKSPLLVVVKRLQFYEIQVSSPSKGKREIYYASEASVETYSGSSSSSDSGSSSSDSGNGSGSSSKFKEWRLCCIDTLQKKMTPPDAPSISNYKINSPKKRSAPSTEEKTGILLDLELPIYYSFLFNVNGWKGDMHSILDALTGEPMTSSLLDAYFTRRIAAYNNKINAGIRSSYKLRPISKTKYHYLSIHFLTFRREDPIRTNIDLKHLPKARLDHNSVVIAPLVARKHFYLAVFTRSTKSVQIYDSCWRHIPGYLRQHQVEEVLAALFPRSSQGGWNLRCVTSAQQIDDSSCGCYVAYFVENILKDKSHRNGRKLSKPEVAQWRAEMVREILPTTKTGRQFLEAITE